MRTWEIAIRWSWLEGGGGDRQQAHVRMRVKALAAEEAVAVVKRKFAIEPAQVMVLHVADMGLDAKREAADGQAV